jgi:hypothetical protein
MLLICCRRAFTVCCVLSRFCADGAATARPAPEELVPVFLFLASLYMHKARAAPKPTSAGLQPFSYATNLEGVPNGSTKESLQQKAVTVINEAVRISPSANLTLLITGIQSSLPLLKVKQYNGSLQQATTKNYPNRYKNCLRNS